MCTPDYYPSSLQDLRGIKLSQFRNFHYLKIWTKPLYIDIDFLWQLLDPSGPRNVQSLFLLTHPYLLLPLLCLTRGPSIYLRNTHSFNTCGPVIRYSCFLSVTSGFCQKVDENFTFCVIMQQVKVKVSRNRPRWPNGFWVGWGPGFSWRFGTTRVVGRQPNTLAAYTPGEIPGTHIQRMSRPQGTWFCWGNHGKSPQWHLWESISGPSD